MRRDPTFLAFCLSCAAAGLSSASPSLAAEAARHSYNLPVQPLSQSIQMLAATARRSIIAPSNVLAGRQAPALVGDYSVDEALVLLLAGSGLRVRRSGDASIIEAAENPPVEDEAPQILITGSRIRGASVASPIIQVTREDARNAGQATLREIVRTIPQNFGGGQNPGIGFNVPEANGADVGGGSSINLRGLGSDATLTLLNGHRLSYNANKQSVDISGIPLGAISRVEIMPDGASALFGSDAVAGVVNIVLRRDLNGLETNAQLAGTSAGGASTQLYAATAGHVWLGGSALLAYQYDSSTALTANQRDYAASRPGLDLLPRLHQHSLLGTVRQDLAADLVLALDGTFTKRRKDINFPLNFAGDLSVSRSHNVSTAEAFGVSASLDWSMGSDWVATLLATYGQDRVNTDGESFFGTRRTDNGSNAYRNRARSIELSGTGPLFEFPGGPVKAAAGIGYRRIDLVRRNRLFPRENNFNQAQADYYAFGEVNLPLLRQVGGSIPVESLTLTAAARYEDYRGVGEVTTPRLGLIYAPTPDFTLKGSWGRSFRAPTLFQRYSPNVVYLTTATQVGGRGYPATATALLLFGGSASLGPERSENWSATLDIHPRALPGASLEIGYFSIHYRNRIVTPIPSFSAALSNPAYSDFVLLNPDSARQAAIIAAAGTFTNISGTSAYVPANVVAFVNNSTVNAARQTISGVDMLARYSSQLGRGIWSGSVNATYLESEQQIAPPLPVTQLAGIIFNPPHWRLRGSLSWTLDPLTVTTAVTHIGSVVDNRTSQKVRLHGMTPVDLTFRLKPDRGLLSGFDIVGSVQNLFNEEPTPIATALYLDTPYDSTNYSPLGRVFSLSILKSW